MDVDAAVTARMQRGLRLRDLDATPYHAVLTEASLRWVSSAGPAATTESLRILLAATGVTTMTVQVIPSGAPMGALPVCGFFMADWKQPDEPAMVIVETPGAELTFVGAEECADFEQAWRHMVEAALDPAASRDFIAELLKE